MNTPSSPTPSPVEQKAPERPPVGSRVFIAGDLYRQPVLVTEHTERGFKYSGAVAFSIPRMGIHGNGTGEAFVDTGILVWTPVVLPPPAPPADGHAISLAVQDAQGYAQVAPADGMKGTPRTDANVSWAYDDTQQSFAYVSPDFVRTLERELNWVEAQYGKELARLRAETQALGAERDQLKEEVARNARDVGAFLGDLNRVLEGVLTPSHPFVARISDLRTTISALESQLADAHQIIDRNEPELKDTRSAIDNARANLQSLTAVCDGLKAELAEARRELEACNSLCDNSAGGGRVSDVLARMLTQLRASLTALKAENEKLESCGLSNADAAKMAEMERDDIRDRLKTTIACLERIKLLASEILIPVSPATSPLGRASHIIDEVNAILAIPALKAEANGRDKGAEEKLIRERGAAEEVADKLTSLILGEPIDWPFHDAKWAEAIEQATALAPFWPGQSAEWAREAAHAINNLEWDVGTPIERKLFDVEATIRLYAPLAAPRTDGDGANDKTLLESYKEELSVARDERDYYRRQLGENKDWGRIDWLESHAKTFAEVYVVRYAFSAPNQDRLWMAKIEHHEFYADTWRRAVDGLRTAIDAAQSGNETKEGKTP